MSFFFAVVSLFLFLSVAGFFVCLFFRTCILLTYSLRVFFSKKRSFLIRFKCPFLSNKAYIQFMDAKCSVTNAPFNKKALKRSGSK